MENIMSRDASPYSKAEYTPTHGTQRQESVGGRPPVAQYDRYEQQTPNSRVVNNLNFNSLKDQQYDQEPPQSSRRASYGGEYHRQSSAQMEDLNKQKAPAAQRPGSQQVPYSSTVSQSGAFEKPQSSDRFAPAQPSTYIPPTAPTTQSLQNAKSN